MAEEFETYEPKTIEAFNDVSTRIESAQATIASLKMDLKEAQAKEGQLNSELLQLLELTEREGKWLYETQQRVAKITLYSQQKNVSWKTLYDLVYNKLNTQIKNIVDVEVQKLKEQAGVAKRETIKIMKKEGSLWSLVQEGWGKLKSILGGILNDMKTALLNIFKGSAQIDETLNEIEEIIVEADVRESSIRTMARVLKVPYTSSNSEIIGKIIHLGDSMAEKKLKNIYIAKLHKVSVKVINEKIMVNEKVFSGVKSAIDEIVSFCDSEDEAFDILEKAIKE